MASRYEKLHQHALQEYEQVSTVLAEVTRQLEEAQQQLESLQAYVQALSQPSGEIAQHHALMQRRHFVHQVFSAIEHQANRVHQLEQQLEHVRAQWLEKRAQVKGLEKLMEKAAKQAQVLEEKKAQRALDERSGWAYSNKKSGFETI